MLRVKKNALYDNSGWVGTEMIVVSLFWPPCMKFSS